jgi:hypothetical protein
VDLALDLLEKHPEADHALILHLAAKTNVDLTRVKKHAYCLLTGPLHSIPPTSLSLLGPLFMSDLLRFRGFLRSSRDALAVPVMLNADPSCRTVAICEERWMVLWKQQITPVLLGDYTPLYKFRAGFCRAVLHDALNRVCTCADSNLEELDKTADLDRELQDINKYAEELLTILQLS